MTPSSCPFCAPDPGRVFLQGRTVFALWDGFPVNAGHALIIPYRHVGSWFEATEEEQEEILRTIPLVRERIKADHAPAGYNIGVNVGFAAGQTVDHLHVHVIPRYQGDVPDPTGGVRNVIPSRGNYLKPDHGGSAAPGLQRGGRALQPPPLESAGEALQPPSLESAGDALQHPPPKAAAPPPAPPATPTLVRGGHKDPLLPHLLAHMADAALVDMAAAFTLDSGVRLVEEHLRDVVNRGGRVRLLTGDYLGVTEPEALLRLLDLQGSAGIQETRDPQHTLDPQQTLDLQPAPTPQGSFELRVFETAGASFHPKAYILVTGEGEGAAFVGSSNLSEMALKHGVEWNYRVVPARDEEGFGKVMEAFQELWDHPKSRPVDGDWVRRYGERRGAAVPQLTGVKPEPAEPPTPHVIQARALEALERTREEGNTAGLVVLATGLGKTWLSAFDSNRPPFRRVLFVAHREEILGQAWRTFRRIRPLATLGYYNGREKAPEADVLFASIQTLSRRRHLHRFDPRQFDYLILDEFHHAAARSYRRLIGYFEPRFLLGLTATPERTDGADLLTLCGDNLVYRADMAEGIKRGLLCPFDYYGVPDEVDYANIPWRSRRFDEEALTVAVATRARAENALEQLRKHGKDRTVAFCVSQRHADFMATFFREQELRAVAVHAGPTSAPRARSLERLEAGELDVVCSVDMFNEGVDLPHVDTLLMLRPTESRILWLQQFGRGLRYLDGKTLRVIDYIGNHRIFLESRFKQTKTVHEIAPVLLTIEGRIEALFFLYFVALLVSALLERDLHRAMAREEMGELPLYPEERKTRRPAAEQVLRLFSLAQRHRLYREGKEVKVFRPTLTDLRTQVLTLLGAPAGVP